jgi:hypothetical protein
MSMDKREQQGALGKVLAQLREVVAKGKTGAAASETITDDGKVNEAKRVAIARDEALAREVLALVGVEYDALIAMDGKTPYSLAVQANPQLTSDVLQAEQPVVAALKVALGYKPYAEFVGKYGKEPGEIRERIRAEMAAEKGPVPEEVKPVAGMVFSGRGGGKVVPAKPKSGGLGDFFKS